MKAFLLTFDTDRVDRNEFLARLNGIEAISNWFAFFPGSVALVSEVDTRDLTKLIRKEAPKSPFLLVAIEDGNRSGFLPQSVWDFIRNPQPIQRLAS